MLLKYNGIANLKEQAEVDTFFKNIRSNINALNYFLATEINGVKIPEDKAVRMSNSAAILDTFSAMIASSNSLRLKQGASRVAILPFIERHAWLMEALMGRMPHTLPFNARRLYNTFVSYRELGFEALLDRRGTTANRRKVTALIENFILSLYAQKGKPFACVVAEMYTSFLNGEIEVVDINTGELYNREDFKDKNGEYITLCESTIWNVINKPDNRVLVDKYRNDSLYYKNVHEPYHHRNPPIYSFSKISMDDRDLPRKSEKGEKVCAYYVYDVASGCVIGASYSLKKDVRLVVNCFRDMFRSIDRNGFGMPVEVEVEHHLMEGLADELSAMFPIVRFCAPANSQEKRAEHLNKAKKYTSEKKAGHAIGRWWARSEAYRAPSEREGAEYKEIKVKYDVLIAEDLQDIANYNNGPHPKYPGMTRTEVMAMYLNPNLQPVNKKVVYRYIGESVQTSIRRSQFVTVQHEHYQLSSPEVLSKLKPNDYDVTAYYLEDSDKNIGNVYLYQGDRYICECSKIERYNEAACERTEADEAAMTEQSKYVSSFRKMVKDNSSKKINKIKVLESEVLDKSVEAQATTLPAPIQTISATDDDMYSYDTDDYAAMATRNL